jgi:hypothetical protein
MSPDIPKPIKRALRELAGRAYEVELRRALDELGRDFDLWRQGGIDSFELSERVHRFHNGPSRDLYGRYTTGGNQRLQIAHAIQEGFIAKDSVPPEVMPYLEGALELVKTDPEGW